MQDIIFVIAKMRLRKDKSGIVNEIAYESGRKLNRRVKKDIWNSPLSLSSTPCD